jgi:hypothetical protein
LTLIVLVFASLLLGLLGYWLATASLSPLRLTPDSALDPDYAMPKLESISHIPGFAVAPNRNTDQFIATALAQFGYPQPLAFSYLEGTARHSLQPKNLIVSFYPLETLDPADRDALLFKYGSPTQLAAGIKPLFTPNRLEYRIYIDTRLNRSGDPEELAFILSYQLIRALFIGNPDVIDNPGLIDEFWRQVVESNQFPLSVTPQTSFLNQIKFLLIPPVYAQDCGDYAECGELKSISACPDGSACTPIKKCPDGSVCPSPTYGCYMAGCATCGADQNVNCNGLSTRDACLAAKCSLPPPYCAYGSCAWADKGTVDDSGGGVPPPSTCYGKITYGCGAGTCDTGLRLRSQWCDGVTKYWCEKLDWLPCTCDQKPGIRVEDLYFGGNKFPDGEDWKVDGYLRSITYLQQNMDLTPNGCEEGSNTCYHYYRYGSRLGNHTTDKDGVPYGRAYLNIPTSGDWTFYLTYHDGARVYIDDNVEVNDWETTPCIWDSVKKVCNYPPKSASFTAYLTSGSHPFQMDYFYDDELSLDKHAPLLKLEWEGPGVLRQVVPWTAITMSLAESNLTSNRGKTANHQGNRLPSR